MIPIIAAFVSVHMAAFSWDMYKLVRKLTTPRAQPVRQRAVCQPERHRQPMLPREIQRHRQIEIPDEEFPAGSIFPTVLPHIESPRHKQRHLDSVLL